MQTNTNKLQGMLYGAFYGDAYSLGGHWVYDTQEIKNASLNLDTCNDPLSTYHPTKKKGDFTHYGDQMFWLLQDLVQENRFSLVDFGERWYVNMKKYDGYVDGASKHTLEKLDESKSFFSCGSPSSDLSAVSRMFPIILKYYDTPTDMQEAIKLHTIVTHMNKDLVMAGAFFSEVTMALLNGGDLDKTLQESSQHFGDTIKQWVQDAHNAYDLDTQEAIQKLGVSCGVNGGFASTIYILLKYKDNFKQALKENMLAGGESAARGMLIGGILGIIHFEDSLKCKEQMNKNKEIS
ncbi:ADP-ribosylglycohydrolase family protein, partial [Sulfurimonas sp. SAG-AH-194-I05]